LLKDVWPELAGATFRRVRDAIRAGYLEGESLDQIVKRLRGTRAQGYKDGIFEVGRKQAEAVVRTAVNHTANAARQVSYDANRRFIKGVQWVSVLDGLTTAVCRGRDGQVYPIDSGPRPPAHFGCRSTTIPVLKRNIPDESGSDGRVPMTDKYDAWLRRQPRGFQDDVLGKAKAKLFRDGGLTLDRFINRAGDELTLDQLREREASAWNKAGL
jgi:SPP1 gp7 family putative phage head morphogenesis protein